MKDIRNTIDQLVEKYKIGGITTLTDGALLVCKAPYVAPMAWVHSFYKGLAQNEIEELEVKLGTSIPDQYKDFLRLYNGFSLFNSALELYGLRRNYKRDVESIHQVFDICTRNVDERLDDAGNNVFFIGRYFYDGSLLYIDKDTGNVHRCNRETVSSLNTWNSFDDALSSEIVRLLSLHDEKGKEIKGVQKTTP
jgi:hypothetical protein